MKGFTIIELMITVAIVAILASVAVPAYSAYSKHAKLTEALTILRATSTNMEITLDDAGTYVCQKNSWDTKYFHYECAASTDNYTITATGLQDIAGYSYSVNAAGEHKTLSHPKGASDMCWKVNQEC